MRGPKFNAEARIAASEELLEVPLYDEWEKPDELRCSIRELDTVPRPVESQGN
jgi:hypothetical protein